jgi:hypothetical protein
VGCILNSVGPIIARESPCIIIIFCLAVYLISLTSGGDKVGQRFFRSINFNCEYHTNCTDLTKTVLINCSCILKIPNYPRKLKEKVPNPPSKQETYSIALHGGGQLPDSPPAQRLPLPLRREQPQLLPLFVAEGMAVAHFVVVGRQLLQKLPHPVPLPHGVDVRHFVFGQGAEV